MTLFGTAKEMRSLLWGAAAERKATGAAVCRARLRLPSEITLRRSGMITTPPPNGHEAVAATRAGRLARAITAGAIWFSYYLESAAQRHTNPRIELDVHPFAGTRPAGPFGVKKEVVSLSTVHVTAPRTNERPEGPQALRVALLRWLHRAEHRFATRLPPHNAA